MTKMYQVESNPIHANELSLLLSCGTVNYAVQVGPAFKYVHETLVCDHSNKSYCAVLSCSTVQVQGGSNFQVWE